MRRIILIISCILILFGAAVILLAMANIITNSESNRIVYYAGGFIFILGVGFLIGVGTGYILRLVIRRIEKNHGIYMKLDIISGECESKAREFYLKDELFIGRNPKCDIIFKSSEVSDKNSRIFINNGIIYIEDLDSIRGTAISGMRIFSPNRLRGGDIISIDDVSFSLKF